MSDDAATGLYLLLAIMLVGSGLLARRLPVGRALRMLLAWAAIFAVGTIGFGYRHELSQLISGRLGNRAVASGGTLRVPMEEDGHFYVDARVNGTPVRLMVDSGATTTTLSASTAAAAAVQPNGMFPVIVNTANGTLEVRRARLASFAVGDIAITDFPVHVSPNDDGDLIGMNFLSRLTRWSVEGRILVLTP